MKTLFPVLCLFLLVSCESRDDKYSRLTIDLYANKISSIFGKIAEIKVEEEIQTPGTLNDFYSVYLIGVEDFINGLNQEEISPLYMPFKDSLLWSAEGLKYYLNYRKQAVASMIATLSFYESMSKSKSDYEEYVILKNSSYSENYFYTGLIIKSLEEYKAKTQEFQLSGSSYLNNIHKMDSLYFLINSLVVGYNDKIIASKLEQKIIIPLTFRDTINDWLFINKSYLQGFMGYKPGI